MAKVWKVPEKADKIFTDREEPRKAFWDKYTYLQDHMDENSLLTYYGIGGIGKTSLIEQLCTELREQKHMYAVVDLENTESKGKIKILRTLATQLVKDKSIKLFRFLAGMRWYAYNTGAPDFIVKEADELLDDNRMMAGLSEWLEAGASLDDLKRALKQIAPLAELIPNVGPIVQMIRGVDQFRAGLIKYKSGKKVAQFLSALKLNENQPRKIEEELHTYLRDDLIDVMSKRKEPLVIFLDTYEVFTNIFQDHSVAIRNEQWLKEMIPYIPGVLWVIAGRDKLEWEARYEVEQHLLGNLSENDTKKFLSGAGIDIDLTDGLYKLTQGVPVFLDICVDRYRELVGEGKKPTLIDFGETTEKLIERYLRHMPVHMKTLAYVLSCLKKWNQDMVEVVAVKSKKFRYDVTEYNEFMKHSYIVKSADERYYMHDIMQNTIYNDKDFDPGLKCEINKLLEEYYIEIYNNKDSTDKTEALGGRVRAFCQTYSSIYEAISIKFNELSYDIITLYNLGQIHDQLIFSRELYEWTENISYYTENKSAVRVKFNSMLLLAYAYSRNGLYNQAVNYAKMALDFSIEQIGGFEHPDTIVAMNDLVIYYREIGHYQDALELSEKVLDARKRTLGDEHLNTIAAMNNLANIYSDVGRYQDALELLEKVLDVRKRTLGDENLNTIAAMNNLAIIYADIGHYQDALELLEKVLDVRKRTLGDENPDTLAAMSNLASRYTDVGRYQDALELSEKVLDVRKRTLGDEHPDTLTAMSNLAMSYEHIGHYQDALELLENALAVRKRILGDEHPDTLAAMNNLANIYRDFGRYQDALELSEKVLDARKRTLGDEHPDTLTAMNNVANAYGDMGHYQEALELSEKVLDVQKRNFGSEHLDTIVAMNNLAGHYRDIGRYQDAYGLFDQALQLSASFLKKNQDFTIMLMANLAVVLEDMGKHAEAVGLKEKVIKKCREELGKDNHTFIMIMKDEDFKKI